ncbi:bifunctional riboflavin kinase/FAD synthetase [bacterium]|nr:bifunctional riboflavin kinase/FAD synthetase [bacterium]
MKIISFEDELKSKLPHLTLVVGGFDGIHLGHQKLIEVVLDKSRSNNTKSGIVTFDPVPKTFFSEGDPIRLLSTKSEKVDIINNNFSLDYLFFLAFNKKIANLSYEKFVYEYVVNTFNTEEIVVGYDHSFGKNAEGNIDSLRVLGKKYGFAVSVIEPVVVGDEPVKSSEIRRLLKEGNIKSANTMLGYSYKMTSKVTGGRKIGGKIGYPTVNVELNSEKCVPRNGVYLVSSVFDGRKKYGMMYIGTSPTVGSVERHGEIHYFDFIDTHTPDRITYKFHKWLRDDVVFPSIEALKFQLAEDKKLAQQMISEEL